MLLSSFDISFSPKRISSLYISFFSLIWYMTRSIIEKVSLQMFIILFVWSFSLLMHFLRNATFVLILLLFDVIATCISLCSSSVKTFFEYKTSTISRSKKSISFFIFEFMYEYRKRYLDKSSILISLLLLKISLFICIVLWFSIVLVWLLSFWFSSTSSKESNDVSLSLSETLFIVFISISSFDITLRNSYLFFSYSSFNFSISFTSKLSIGECWYDITNSFGISFSSYFAKSSGVIKSYCNKASLTFGDFFLFISKILACVLHSIGRQSIFVSKTSTVLKVILKLSFISRGFVNTFSNFWRSKFEIFVSWKGMGEKSKGKRVLSLIKYFIYWISFKERKTNVFFVTILLSGILITNFDVL